MIQAKFSFVLWPFSMKVLWAPLVDSLFIRKLGRRKSWLIPVQYSLGVYNYYLIAFKPDVNYITFNFIFSLSVFNLCHMCNNTLTFTVNNF